MGIFQNNLMGAAAAAASAGGGGFYSHQIEQSVRFEEDAGDKIARTPGSSGNRRTWTVSFWYKKLIMIIQEITWFHLVLMQEVVIIFI